MYSVDEEVQVRYGVRYMVIDQDARFQIPVWSLFVGTCREEPLLVVDHPLVVPSGAVPVADAGVALCEHEPCRWQHL